jgi:hypothetical protein
MRLIFDEYDKARKWAKNVNGTMKKTQMLTEDGSVVVWIVEWRGI